MTVVSALITQALRETNTIALTGSPSTAEFGECLDRLQSILDSVLGTTLGYIMEDWNVSSATSILKPSGIPVSAAGLAAFTVPPQARLQCYLTAATTLKLDPQPQDGQRFAVIDDAGNFPTYSLTISPNGRKINGLSALTLNTSGSTQYIYQSDTGNWVPITTLALTDNWPFPRTFDDYFIIMLAMRMNPRYGRALSDESKQRYTQIEEDFIDRYKQTRLRAAAVPTPGG